MYSVSEITQNMHQSVAILFYLSGVGLFIYLFLAKICWFWICLGYLTFQATLLQPGEKCVLCHLKCLILLSIYFIQFWKCICICFKS